MNIPSTLQSKKKKMSDKQPETNEARNIGIVFKSNVLIESVNNPEKATVKINLRQVLIIFEFKRLRFFSMLRFNMPAIKFMASMETTRLIAPIYFGNMKIPQSSAEVPIA